MFTSLFVPAVRFQGLPFDSKLLWEPHLRWLHTKCRQSLNIVKVLSGRSWCGDQMVMLQLYCSLIRSKIDYGSFMHNFTAVAAVCNLSISNTGIHFVIGTFHSSWLESLCMQSVWQSWLLKPIMHPTVLLELHVIAPWPVGACFHNLL